MDAIFIFSSTSGGWKLSNSSGQGMYKFWGQEKFTYFEALQRSDLFVGQYVRDYSPMSIKYIIESKEPSQDAKIEP